jgi:hypothetical protein
MWPRERMPLADKLFVGPLDTKRWHVPAKRGMLGICDILGFGNGRASEQQCKRRQSQAGVNDAGAEERGG